MTGININLDCNFFFYAVWYIQLYIFIVTHDFCILKFIFINRKLISKFTEKKLNVFDCDQDSLKLIQINNQLKFFFVTFLFVHSLEIKKKKTMFIVYFFLN